MRDELTLPSLLAPEISAPPYPLMFEKFTNAEKLVATGTLEDVATPEAFCRDPDTRQLVAVVSQERAQRLGKRAMVKLEQLVSRDHTDLRAQVLAVRTALEVSGDLKRDHSPPIKSVKELSVAELATLIDSTRAELDARIARQRAGAAELVGT